MSDLYCLYLTLIYIWPFYEPSSLNFSLFFCQEKRLFFLNVAVKYVITKKGRPRKLILALIGEMITYIWCLILWPLLLEKY